MERIIYPTKEESKKAYMDNVTLHRDLIKKAFNIYGKKFSELLDVNFDELEIRINQHDLSKIQNEDEIEGYRIYNFPSVEDSGLNPQKIKLLYEKAMFHHYSVNNDHPEHWVNIENKNNVITNDMDNISICEMVLDWIAFGDESKERDNAVQYWFINRGNRRLTYNTTNKIDILIDYLKTCM